MPSCVIYFTDGYCDSFPEPPDYPTLWILTDKANFQPPFGEVIHIEQRDIYSRYPEKGDVPFFLAIG
jgi:predicted metal-dependent peptidase